MKKILSLLSLVLVFIIFATFTTHCYRAFAYNGGHDYSVKQKGEVKSLRLYLEELYNSSGGPNWKNKTNWCTNAPVDQWEGVRRDYYNKNLYVIDLKKNGLKGSVNLEGCPYISNVYFGGNELVVLNLRDCENLVSVDIKPGYGSNSNGTVNTLDVSGCKKLEKIHLYNVAGLECVRAQDCIELTSFSDPGDSSLVVLDLSGCTKLETVYVSDNKLTTLKLEGCEKLYDLNCENNKLTTLDLSTCTSLTSVNCFNNHIRSAVQPYMKDLRKNNNCRFQMDWLYEYSSSSTWGEVPEGWKEVGKDLYAKENEYGWYFQGEPKTNHHSDPDSWE